MSVGRTMLPLSKIYPMAGFGDSVANIALPEEKYSIVSFFRFKLSNDYAKEKNCRWANLKQKTPGQPYA